MCAGNKLSKSTQIYIGLQICMNWKGRDIVCKPWNHPSLTWYFVRTFKNYNGPKVNFKDNSEASLTETQGRLNLVCRYLHYFINNEYESLLYVDGWKSNVMHKWADIHQLHDTCISLSLYCSNTHCSFVSTVFKPPLPQGETRQGFIRCENRLNNKL